MQKCAIDGCQLKSESGLTSKTKISEIFIMISIKYISNVHTKQQQQKQLYIELEFNTIVMSPNAN